MEEDALDYYTDNNYFLVNIIENDKNEIVETETYGTEAYYLTNKDIEALKDGKLIVVYPNNEYTCIFRYKMDKKRGKKENYIVSLKNQIENLNNQIETMKRNVLNDYISKLTIERLIAELEPKQKFREIAILKELLYKRS